MSPVFFCFQSVRNNDSRNVLSTTAEGESYENLSKLRNPKRIVTHRCYTVGDCDGFESA
jgi:hypothetical protein